MSDQEKTPTMVLDDAEVGEEKPAAEFDIDPFADEEDNGSLALYFCYERDGEDQVPVARLAYTHAGGLETAKKLTEQIAFLLSQIFAKMESLKRGEPSVIVPDGIHDWKKDA